MDDGSQVKSASKLQRQLAGQIARYIGGQALAPGTQLTELGLANVFRVSRTPIRAALELLAELGIVENAHRRGYMVAEPVADLATLFPEEDLDEDEALYVRIASDHLSGKLGDHFSEADLMRRYEIGRGLLNRVLRRMALDLVIERNQGRGWSFAPMLKSADAEAESYRFRLLLEPAAILEPGYSIDKARAEASRRAHETMLKSDPQRVSPLHFFEVNAEFHELIAAGSHNSFIIQTIQQQNRLRRLLSLQWSSYAEHRVAESCEEHMAVLAAIEAGDLEWASALLRRHLELAARLHLPEPDGTAASAH